MSYQTKQSRPTRGAERFSRNLLCSASFLAGVVALGAGSAANAADRYWDANGTSVGGGGTGTWNPTNLNWSPNNDGVSGPFSLPWNNAALDNAIFAGTAGTVTVGAPITVQNLTFNTAGYTLAGGTLTLGSATPTITTASNGNTAINSVIAGSSGFVKAGVGALLLNGANTFTGDIYLNLGRIYAGSDAALGAAGNNIFTAAGANIRLSIAGASTNRTVTIGNGGNLILEGAGAGSALITGNGSVSPAAGGVIMSNDASTYTGRTTFSGCNGVCSTRFTSIRNLGEASSLGAPTTIVDGTIIFNQQSQYSDSLIYLGDGDSSNRNWDINGNGALIRNQGTGALTITGNVDISTSGSFNADTADFNLLGVLSGGRFGFGSAAGYSVTLGGANTFTGQAVIGGRVRASVLADIGSVSSLGAGSDIALNAGTLSYTGAGNSSNRLWTVSGASTIANDGSGALNLSGAAAFVAGGAADSLTLGGSFAGQNTFSGVISGAINLIGDGSGTWVVGGANTFAGTVTVNAGTLRAGNASAFGLTKGIVVNGGTLDLGGYDLTAPSLTGTGGTVALGASALTVEALNSQIFAGSITGTGGLRKMGAGSLTLTGVSSYTGATTISGGKLALDFSGVGGPADNILSAGSPLVLSGGTLEVLGAAGETNSQSFNGLTVSAGSNTVRAINGAGGGLVNLNLGVINRTNGLVNFVLPDAGAISTTNADGLLGGWATINATDYAKVVGGQILAFDAADYTDKDDAATWLSGEIISDTANAVNTPFFGTVGGNVQLGGLRYTAAANSTVTINAGNTLGVDGTIIVAPSTLAANQVINGQGSLTGGAGGGSLGFQHNGTGKFSVIVSIVDNGGQTGVTKGGVGTLALTGANSYTAATILTGGTLEVNSIANGGIASNIGASSASSSNLVLENGNLQYTGATNTTDRGFTLVSGGPARTIQVTQGGTNLTFTGEVTSPDDAGFTKTGAGTLTLANAANSYVGVTTVSGGRLSVNTLADGGMASGIGAATSDSANLVLRDGGRLQYTGGTASTDRGFTLANGVGGIDVAQAGTTLTVSGLATGAGTFTKDGAGTLVLSGVNSSFSGDTIVAGGTMRAGSAQAFGPGTRYITIGSGAVLDLGGFNVSAGGVAGGGTIALGGRTLTTAGGQANFTGAITGTGGFTRGSGSYTQTFTGCNNTYTGVTTISGSLAADCIQNGGLASGIGASSAASANLVFHGGTLTYTGGNASTDRGFTLTANGVVNVHNAATTLEFQGGITGSSGDLFKVGDGTLVLSGMNTYAGATRVSGGTLQAGSTQAFGAAAPMLLSNVAGAILDLDGYNTSVSYLELGGPAGGNVELNGATLTITAGNNVATSYFGGAIKGTGNLIKNGTGTQKLTGCSSDYSGVTTINGGILQVTCLTDGGLVSSMGMSSAVAGNLIINGGTLRYAGAGDSTNRQFTLGASGGNALDASGTGAINFTSNAPLTFSSTNTAQTLTLTGTNTGNNTLAALITNNGTGVTALTKTGAGTWVLTNPASTYTGVTTISGGVLGVDKLANGGVASSLGASSAAAANLVIGNGSTLRYTGAGDTTNRLFTLAAGVTFIESSGAGAVVFTDTGPVTLQGNNATRTIALGGTNTGNNTLAGSIGNAGTGVTSLAKNDSGTWVLTGNHTYTGPTNVNGGILSIGGGGTTGSVASATINNFGTLVFNRSNGLTYGGAIVGNGGVQQVGNSTTILTGTNGYTGGTAIAAGTLQLGNGGTTGSILGDVLNDSVLAFNRSNLVTFGGVISGTGQVTQDGTGTTILTGTNSYAGGTAITAGTLQISGDANLGVAAGPLSISNATLQTTADIASVRDVTLTGNATLLTNAGTTFTLGSVVSGDGGLIKSGAGRTILAADNNYAGGTTISQGTLQLGNGGTSGSIAGNVANNGSLAFNRSDNIALANLISGTGAVTQDGTGTVTLTAENSYAGATTVNRGTLLVNGNQAGATGLTTVNAGAALGGSGTIGGNVVIADGGILTPGNAAGTLTIAGDLSLSGGSILNFEFGQANVAGGPLNDLVEVGGDLVLDGTINVSVPNGGAFGGGIYRVFNYGGTLTDNGLSLGLMPGGSSVTIQTAVDGQVNLVNAVGLSLSFWDGDVGPKANGVIDGGNGTWQNGTGNDNWTDASGAVNAEYEDETFAIFAGTGGTVTIDNGPGSVRASGMQFASTGYVITGDDLTLVGPESAIRVGDGTAAGAGFTTTIDAALTGATQLVKTDFGTLVLTGTNSYTGGAAINGGTLRIARNDNLGDVAGAISFNGGTLNTTANFASDRAVTLAGAGTVLTNAGTVLTLDGVIDGVGSFAKSGAGRLILTNDSSYTGGTTINAGQLQIGSGGVTGSVLGNIVNNAELAFSRANTLTYTGAISGTGIVTQMGSGSTILTGINTYTGATTIDAGTLQLQSGGQINGTSGLIVNGGGQLIVDGVGTALVTGTGNSYVGSAQNNSGTLIVRNGATASFDQLDVALQLNSTGRLDVIGAGSQVTTTGTAYFGGLGLATVNVLDGATMATANAFVGGQTSSSSAVVTVSGANSEWAVADGFYFSRGTVTVANGGVVTADFAIVGYVGDGLNDPSADMIVTGAGSRFETNGTFDITNGDLFSARGTLTIADGGVVRVGSGTLAMGVGNAALNIGGAEDLAAAAAGTLDANAITFAAATNRVNFNHDDANYVFAAAMSGAGNVNHTGPGTTILTGNNSHTGGTIVNAGTLLINGNQSAATGLTLVNSGATLGGIGMIGGTVTATSGSIINPGSLGAVPGTLTIMGDLNLNSTTTLNFNFGQANVAGGPLNDLISVGGDLVLDGTLNVQTSGGGSFDPGVYRVISYAGDLTDAGLELADAPSANYYVQTSVPGQVNLVNTAGLALRYWDGDTIASKNNSLIEGGDGLWQNATGNDNWTEDTGAANAPFADSAFAVFMGAAGTVTVDSSLGGINVGGMQFLTDGYAITGDAITMVGPQATIRVGDGTAAGADSTASIAAELAGTAQLVKSDLGTLILTGVNSYTGGTAINGGVLQIASDSNLGDGATGLTFNGGTLRTTADIDTGRAVDLAGSGTLLTDAATTLSLTGAINGAGGLSKLGAGILVLTGANSYTGDTFVGGGALFVNGNQLAATGLTGVGAGAVLAGTGFIGGDVSIANDAILDPGGVDGLAGILSIGGSLSLNAGSTLAMQFGAANTVGGALNDLIEVRGDLLLDGTLDVSVSTGGTFGPGIYRVINYGGTLTNNGLNLGLTPGGSTSIVQTSVTGQVNLVNTGGLALNFWDGSPGPKFDGAINGGDGVWQNITGNDNWTDASGTVNATYADGAYAIFAGTGGVVTIENSLGNVSASGMQIAADGYSFVGDALTLDGPQSTIRVGDGSTAGAAFTATIAAELTGNTQLVKTDAGTLVLSGNNSYSGGTAVEGGTLAVSADANLGDAAGGLTFGGGTLRTTADFASDRALSFTGNGALLTDAGTTFTLNGTLSGTGTLTKDGAGTLVLTGSNAGYTTASNVAGGTLAVDGVIGSTVNVSSGARLEGIGQVGGIANSGVVAAGRSIGILTVAGDYFGNGGTLEIEAVLGGDSSSADRLVVNGATSGSTQVTIINREGIGGQTVEGIKIIDVTGASNGTFALNGDYLFQGEQAVVAGAFSYRLYQGGVSTPTDGDWYLRSSLTNPADPNPEGPTAPIYQPGVSVYENYAQTLLSLNSLPTLQQRVGNRSWAAVPVQDGMAIWGRAEASHKHSNPAFSTSAANSRTNSWQLQMGADATLADRDDGAALIGGITAHYGEADARVRSMFGNGGIDTQGFGFGATLTWYGPDGFYVDGQAQLSWFNTDLASDPLGSLAANIDGKGEAVSLEVGKRASIGGSLTITPQTQMVYSHVGFDRFLDPAGADVAARRGDSLKSRWGLSIDHQSRGESATSGKIRSSHVYGLVNLNYEWLDGVEIDVAGTPIANRNHRLWGELGMGASVSWGDRVTLYAEATGETAMRDFGDSYRLKGNVGLRVQF